MSELIGLSAFWPGYRITDLQIQDRQVLVRLEPDEATALVCSDCGRTCACVHDSQWRRVRDLPMLGRVVAQQVRTRRLACP